ncbi:RidA family protein [uncultured Methylobacterium sp.]|uniref:RidA family protein n=1 Tax=uncultured Methylobacterium sp. TaxID=157278 RepID=UPI0035CC0BA4
MSKPHKIHHHVPRASPPPASSRYAHAVQAAGWLHVTGQLPTDPDDPAAPLRPGIAAQAEMCFENIARILDHTGYALDDAVFVRIYLRAFERDFAAFNAVYARHFPSDRSPPGRTTVGVAALGRGALVEIDLVCYKPEDGRTDGAV